MKLAQTLYQIDIVLDPKTNTKIIKWSGTGEAVFKEFIQQNTGEYFLEIKTKTQIRSGKQNKYYWKLLNLLEMYFKETGNNLSADFWHDCCREVFLGYKTIGNLITKIETKTLKSTTSLTTKEFVEYIDKIILYFAEEYKITLPKPDEIENLDFI